MKLPDFLTQDQYGYIFLTGHRIGFNHVILYYKDGYSPEMLWEQYPTLSLALIHKVIGYYLENRQEADEYIAREEAEIERQRAAAKKGPSLQELKQRLEIRQRLESRRQAEAL